MQIALVSDPLFYALAVPATLIVGISKGGFGGGVGLIGVPIIALAIPLPQAAAILLPILCLMDLFALWAYRGHWDGANLRTLLPASMVGIALGAWAFGTLDDGWIRGIVGVIAVAFTLHYWLGLWRRGGEEGDPTRPNVLRGSLWGTLSGFTSCVAHAGGPPMSVYLLPQRLDRRTYVGTTVLLFAAFNYVKLIPYGWLGQLHAENLTTSLLLAPLAPLGIALGRWLNERVNERLFYRTCYALLFAVGLRLIYDGLVR